MESVIKFRLGRIPVTVRPTFWLVAFLLGLGLGDRRLQLAWVVTVFLSVLVHELGHALTARRFGASVDITLTTLGGFTRWSKPEGGIPPGRRAVVAAAGSAVGIAVGLVVLGLYLWLRPGGQFLATVVLLIVWVNVGWGVLNWLPIRPLDGGHLVLAFLDLVAPRRADRIADAIFLWASLGAVAAALYFRLYFAAALAGFMAWGELSRRFGGEGPEPAAPVFSYDDPPEEERH